MTFVGMMIGGYVWGTLADIYGKEDFLKILIIVFSSLILHQII